MIIVFYDTNIYHKSLKIDINNHFVDNMYTTFFENEFFSISNTMNISLLGNANR